MKLACDTVTLLTLLTMSSAFFGCSSCEEVDDEALIRKLIDDAAGLAEKRDIGGLMDLATDDFTADPGSRDRRGVKGVLFIAFQSYGKFKVKYPRPSVDLKPGADTAEAETPFLIVPEGQKMPDLTELYEDPEGWVERVGGLADPYHLKIELVKDGSEWLVKKAEIIGLGRIEGI